MAAKILVFIIILALFATVALFVQSAVMGTLDLPTTLKFFLVAVSLATSLFKFRGAFAVASRTPEFYLRAYEFLISDAFRDDKRSRKTLGKALKLYNESKYGKAIELLEGLERSARGFNECRTVGIFIALCYTDWGLLPQAEKRLEELADAGVANFTVYNNLGYVRSGMGKHDKALDAYELAESYAAPEDLDTLYVNIARAYVAQDELCAAEDYALKALEANPDRHQAASILAMVYDASGDEENFEKYFDLAISKGQDEVELLHTVNEFTARFKDDKNA